MGLDPSFSPNGSKLVFSSNADGEFDNSSFDTDPTYSPDGSRIAFLPESDLHVMNADGTGELTAVPRGVLGTLRQSAPARAGALRPADR